MARMNKAGVERGERDSNMELLRVVCMFLIVWNHLFTHGVWDDGVGVYVTSKVLSMGKLGVNVFVMITGWFMAKSHFKSRSLIRILSTAGFYAVVMFGVGWLGRGVGMTPAISVPWFVITYSLMYLLVPILNLVLRTLDRRHLKSLLWFLFFVMSVVPTVSGKSYTGLSTDLPWFCFLYLLSGCFRLWGLPSKGRVAVLWASGAILHVEARAMDALVKCGGGVDVGGMTTLLANTSDGTYLPVLMLSVAMFASFASLGVGQSKLVNKVGSSTFGIYLIHDNAVIRHWLWSRLGFLAKAGVLPFIFESALLAASVFVVCSLVEVCRLEVAQRVGGVHLPDDSVSEWDAFMNDVGIRADGMNGAYS